MRIINTKTLRAWGQQYPDARSALDRWAEVAGRAQWRSLQGVRRELPHADGVLVASGRTATVFNIRGNHYRLITAIHYNKLIVYTLRFLTHADYDREGWKDEL